MKVKSDGKRYTKRPYAVLDIYYKYVEQIKKAACMSVSKQLIHQFYVSLLTSIFLSGWVALTAIFRRLVILSLNLFTIIILYFIYFFISSIFSVKFIFITRLKYLLFFPVSNNLSTTNCFRFHNATVATCNRIWDCYMS